jgi:hypothetical protein
MHWMRLSRDRNSPWFSDPSGTGGWQTQRWATPFSGFRWAIPEIIGFSGRALYMDTDMLALGDIAELWRLPPQRPTVVRARTGPTYQRFCVALWDGHAAQQHLPDLQTLQSDPKAHTRCTQYFRDRPQLVAPLDPEWNCIDGEDLPIDRIRLLHYSDMGTQFTHRRAFARLAETGQTHWFDGKVLPHPRRDLAELFEQVYVDALASGRRPEDYRASAPYGPVIKKSERHHKGNVTTRPEAHASPWPFRIGRNFD